MECKFHGLKVASMVTKAELDILDLELDML